MLTKSIVQKSIDILPNSFTIDDLIEKLIFIDKVEKGLLESEQGKTISNEEVKKMIDEWSN